MKLKHQIFVFALSLMVVTPVSADDVISREEAVVLIKDISELLQENYVFPERREAYANELLERFEEASLPAEMSLQDFTEKTTEQLRDLSGDRHLYVEKLPARKSFNEDWESLERAAEKEHNYGFQAIEVFAGNIGYLKISKFMHPQRGFATASAAMTYLAQTNALIIDLRGNRGGYGGLAELIVSWFFSPAPTHLMTTLYSDPNKQPTELYSLPFVPTERRVDLPVYVLINGRTASAAEFLAYTLQAFDKAIIVGTPSSGAAHRNSYFPLNDQLRVSISTGAPVNPVTETNWEGTGVIPDIEVASEEALMVALSRAQKQLGVK